MSMKNNISLPKGWKWVKCRDVIDVRDGTHDTPQYVYDGIPLITSKNLSSGTIDFSDVQLISEKDHQNISKRSKVDRGDILYAMIGTIGNPVIVETDMIFSIKNVALFKFHQGYVYNKYFKYLLDSGIVKRQVFLNTRGGNQKFASLKVLRDLTIPLPPLAEQKRIANILDRSDEIRQKRQQAIKIVDDFSRAIFLDMFGDPITNPKGWEIVTCESICKRITVGIVVRPASYYCNTGVPAFRSLNIRENKIIAENLVYFSEKDNETKLAKTRIWKDDLILVRSGQPGTAAVVTEEFNGANAIDLLIATPNKSKVNPIYLSYYFNSQGGKRLILGEQRGQIQKHLNISSLKPAPIPLPPISKQISFSDHVLKIQKMKEKLTLGNNDFRTLYNSLIQHAFRGEL